MRRTQLHVMVPNNLMALLVVESDKSGDSLAAVVRRCIRGQLASLASTDAYRLEYDHLQQVHAEEE